jgi:3-hydroxyacyl-[acyl-carrier-protein] dehydratase
MNPASYPLPYPAEKLIPHRASMRLVDNLNVYETNLARTDLTISDKHLFLQADNTLDPLVFVELLAQLSACHSGYEARILNGDEKAGYLVGVRDLVISEAVHSGEELKLEVCKREMIEQISFIDGTIHSNGRLVASGLVKLFELPATQFRLEEPPVIKKETAPLLPLNPGMERIARLSALHREIVQRLCGYEAAPAEAKISFCFDQSFIGFNGHFPDRAIMPGVMILKAAMIGVELMLGQPVKITNIKQAKFVRIVYPGEIITIHLRLQKKEGLTDISAQVYRRDELCAKFTVISDDHQEKI